MKTHATVLLVAAVGIAGFAGGYLVSDLRSPGSPDPLANRAEVAAPAAAGAPASPYPGDSLLAGSDKEGRLFAALRDPNYLRRSADMFAAARTLTADEIPPLLEKLRGMPADAREMLLPIILGRWAEIDPRAAGAHVLAITEHMGRDDALRSVISTWVENDPNGAREWVNALPNGKHRTVALQSFVSALALRSPQDALAFIQKSPADSRTFNGYQAVFGAWAQADPAAAAQAALALPKNGDRRIAIRGVALRWAFTNPAAAMSWAKNITEPALQGEVVRQVLATWALSDASAAKAAVSSMEPAEVRSRAVRGLVANLATQDPQAARDLLSELPDGPARTDAAREYLRFASISDAKAATEYLEASPELRNAHDAYSIVSAQRAREDLNGALAWASTLEGDARKSAFEGILQTWNQHDPQAALEYFRDKGLLSVESGMLTYAFHQLAGNDPQAALDFARKLEPGELQKRAVENIISAIADANPRHAATVIETLPTGARDDATVTVAVRWSQADLEAAARWTASLPEGVAKTRAARTVVQNLAGRDLSRAAAWLEKVPAGQARDAAVGEYATRVAAKDPAGAAAWAVTISDPQARDGSIERIYRSWFRNDQEGARNFISRTEAASPQLKQRLMEAR